jgi:hypothetical protein
MLRVLGRTIAWLLRLALMAVALPVAAQNLQVIGKTPEGVLVCQGPLGPGPCDLIRQWMMTHSGVSTPAPVPQPNFPAIGGGNNSIFNNPGQLLGGSNSILNNPGQVFQNNSFLRCPSGC